MKEEEKEKFIFFFFFFDSLNISVPEANAAEFTARVISNNGGSYEIQYCERACEGIQSPLHLSPAPPYLSLPLLSSSILSHSSDSLKERWFAEVHFERQVFSYHLISYLPILLLRK